MGIFISTDRADQFWNDYSYCGGDPVNLIDPDGNSVPWGLITTLASAATVGYVSGVIGNNGEFNPAKWENHQSWMIGTVIGAGIGAGIGYGIEAGWFQSGLSSKISSGFNIKGNLFQKAMGRWAIRTVYMSSWMGKNLVDDIIRRSIEMNGKVDINISLKQDPQVNKLTKEVTLNPRSRILYDDPNDPNFNKPWNRQSPKVSHFHELTHRLHDLEGTFHYSEHVEEWRTTGLKEYDLNGELKIDYMETEKYNENAYRRTIGEHYRDDY